MKNICIALILTISLSHAVFAQSILRADETIPVDAGKVLNTGILSDEKGFVFLEFLKGSFVNYKKDQQPFSGDILPPAIIDRPIKLPRHRMRDILSFELLTDNVETVSFVDRYTLMHPKQYLRATLENPDGLSHGQGIKFLTRIYKDDNIGLPSLWVLEEETNNDLRNSRTEKYWKKVGGKLTDSEEGGVQVFSAVITKTGVYGLFDEDPYAYYSPNTPLETVEKVEVSPYPSVVPQSPLPPISEPEVPVDDGYESFEEDNFYLDENNNIQLIPAVEDVEEEAVIDTRIIPAIEEPVIPALEEQIVPAVEEFQDLQTNDPNIPTLPVAGPDVTSTPSSSFPFILLLAFAILGGSFYLAFKKQY